MARKKRGSNPSSEPVSSGEVKEPQGICSSPVKSTPPKGFSIEKIDPVMYGTRAAPRLKVVIVAANEEQLNDAKIIKHQLRRDRIRSSIYYLGDERVGGVINATEELLSEAIKTSCCVLCLDSNSYKYIALRSWLSGRMTATWQIDPKVTPEYQSCSFNLKIDRIYQIPAAVRRCKSLYSKEFITDIKRTAFTFAEF